MLSKRNKNKSFLAYMIQPNLTLIGCSFFLFCFLFLLYTVSNYNGIFYYGPIYSLADAYIWFLKPRAYGILITPFIAIIYINLTKYDSMHSILIRLGAVELWIKRKVITAILLSIVVAVIAIAVITCITSLQVTSIINWDKEQSVYYIMTGHINGQVGFEHVIFMSFITIFIRNIFLCFTIILLQMVVNNIFTFLFITSITIFEMIQKYIPLFYHFITLDYKLWESPVLVSLYFGYCIAAIVFFALAITKVSKKKEWMNEV